MVGFKSVYMFNVAFFTGAYADGLGDPEGAGVACAIGVGVPVGVAGAVVSFPYWAPVLALKAWQRNRIKKTCPFLHKFRDLRDGEWCNDITTFDSLPQQQQEKEREELKPGDIVKLKPRNSDWFPGPKNWLPFTQGSKEYSEYGLLLEKKWDRVGFNEQWACLPLECQPHDGGMCCRGHSEKKIIYYKQPVNFAKKVAKVNR